jgi:hypothetical protein
MPIVIFILIVVSIVYEVVSRLLPSKQRPGQQR